MKINSTTIILVGAAGLGIAYFMNIAGFKDKVTDLLQSIKPGGGADESMPVDSESARARYY